MGSPRPWRRFVRLSVCALGFGACAAWFSFGREAGAVTTQRQGTGPEQVRRRLGRSESMYLGVYVPEARSDDLSGLRTFEADAGRHVSIVHWFQAWGAPSEQASFQTQGLSAIREHGAIPLVTWAPRAKGQSVSQPAYALANIAAGSFDDYIRSFARAAKVWGHPFFLRFAHEMNGNWYPWSETVNGNAFGDYVRAWRHVHDLFAAEGATNVSWVWCPSRVNTNPRGVAELFPGDEYVDWVAMDGYNQPTSRTGWQSFADIFAPLYATLIGLSSKPVMVAETSSLELGGSKAAWITKALSPDGSARFPRLRAVVWFNQHFTGQSDLDWRIESSASAQDAFAAAISSPRFASNDFASFDESPIPAPPE